jgi:outer membrane protease
MGLKRNTAFCTIFLLFSTIANAQTNLDSRENAMDEALSLTQTKAASIEKTLQTIEEKQAIEKEQTTKEKIDYSMRQEAKIFALAKAEKYLVWGLRMGYIKGNTAYDFNHHTSELEFPMDNLMAGTNLCAGFKNLSLNFEAWLPIEDYSGFEMKDKDWTNGVLTSYTKSKAYMDAVILDGSFQYDFYKKDLPQGEGTIYSDEPEGYSDNLRFDKARIGILLGYRFEKFDFDEYDLWYPELGVTTNQGVKVGTYRIKYNVPYFGLATELIRENWGFGANLKYSFYPTAKDVDNHLLRGLTFYGDYDKKGEAWLGSIYGFWEFAKNWNLTAGADGTSVRIDGITWEEQRDPSWDAHQNTDMKHWIFWSGIEYKF